MFFILNLLDILRKIYFFKSFIDTLYHNLNLKAILASTAYYFLIFFCFFFIGYLYILFFFNFFQTIPPLIILLINYIAFILILNLFYHALISLISLIFDYVFKRLKTNSKDIFFKMCLSITLQLMLDLILYLIAKFL